MSNYEEAYNKGMIAAFDRKLPEDNPYDPTSDDYFAWEEGYNDYTEELDELALLRDGEGEDEEDNEEDF